MQVFLPVRSNRYWFQNPDSVARLEQVLKCYMVMYEHVIVQDGRYIYTVFEGGEVAQQSIPAHMLENRSQLMFIEPGGKVRFNRGEKENGEPNTLWEKKFRSSVVADFYPVLSKAGVLDDECWDFRQVDLDEIGKQNSDVVARSVGKGISPDAVGEDYIIRRTSQAALLADSLLAHEMQLPFLCGYQVGQAATHSKDVQYQLSESTGSIFQRRWIEMGLPDFGSLPWAKVQQIRNSTAGCDFRDMVARVSEEVARILLESPESVDAGIETSRYLMDELLNGMKMMRLTPGKIISSLALSPLPVLSNLAAITDFAEQQNSWVSMLFREDWR